MAASKFTEFNLPRNAYTAFDAVSMKQLITNRIKASNLFPDIDFEGSNISGLVDIVAYMYHVLLFYLNQTASETMFSQTELYENMNKLVSLIGYKPQGYHTAQLGIDCTAKSNLDTGTYTIKRFTYTYINNIAYVFNSDVTFEKTLSGDQLIETVGNNHTLYQGTIKEYPLYSALGEDFEQFTLTVSTPTEDVVSKYIDNNNIFVFVRDVNNETWSEWTEVSSLYIAYNKSSVFEKRYNENGRYEIKFGNSVNGRKLNAGDQVAVYYLQSDGDQGAVTAGKLSGKPLTQFNTTQWNAIFNNIKNNDLTYVTTDQLQYISLNNPIASTKFTVSETVDEIRNNAPLVLSMQNRTVTVQDYDTMVRRYFNNIVSDVSVVSNRQYTADYLKYFYDIGLERPNDDEQVLFNQITFTDACDFNNVYLFVVPKNGAIQNNTTPISLATSLKQAIVNRLDQTRLVNQNIVISDPVYTALSFGLNTPNEVVDVSIKDLTKLRITRSSEYNTSKDLILSKAVEIITQFSTLSNNKLGGVVDVTQLNNILLSIGGVQKIETVRYDLSGNTLRVVPKINLISWNPLYPQSTPIITSQNIQLEFFKFPFFYDVGNLSSRIEVV